MKKNDIDKRIPIKTPEGYVFVDYHEIVRIDASHNHTVMFLASQTESIKILPPMKEVVEKSQNGSIFFQCHRSHLVNLLYVQEFKEKARELVTKNGSVPIAKEYIKEFKEAYCK